MKIIAFGDFLMHFSPIGNERFIQADTYKLSFTGAEANVVSALSFWNKNCKFVTALPSNAIADKSIAFLKSLNVNTEHVIRKNGRMGVYFLETGASVRASSVIYDRQPSVFTQTTFDEYNFDDILDGANYLFITGITPALSDNLFNVTLKLLKKCKELGVKVIYDVNLRSNLITAENAGKNLKAFAPYLHLLISNEEHLKSLLDISTSLGEDQKQERLKDLTEQAQTILDVPNIAITVRRTHTLNNATVSASLKFNDKFSLSKDYSVHVVDRVGSGDAFSAGLVYALTENYNVDDAVDFAVASNAIKHTVINDVNYVSIDEINSVRKGGYDVKR